LESEEFNSISAFATNTLSQKRAKHERTISFIPKPFRAMNEAMNVQWSFILVSSMHGVSFFGKR
jgi:hypothetical protein